MSPPAATPASWPPGCERPPTPTASPRSTGDPLAEHPYAIDLVYDACNAGPGDLPAAAAKRLAQQAPDLATQFLPNEPSWELEAAAVRDWLRARDIIVTRDEV